MPSLASRAMPVSAPEVRTSGNRTTSHIPYSSGPGYDRLNPAGHNISLNRSLLPEEDMSDAYMQIFALPSHTFVPHFANAITDNPITNQQVKT